MALAADRARNSREGAGTAAAGRGGGHLFFSAGMPLWLAHGSIREIEWISYRQLFGIRKGGGREKEEKWQWSGNKNVERSGQT